ncbi:MAG: outer membrane lipoprotein-sorting protein [Brevinematales bacterium]|nr:outer membrane lipoprotein-sorting protein [Brevinematales bacterium]
MSRLGCCAGFMVFWVLFVFVCGGYGFGLSGEEILRKIDGNLDFKSAIMTARMEIHLPGQPPRVKVFKVWVVGEEKAYVEFINKEDRNIRYLKIGRQLWVYDKSENNTFLISGHLLKQGMMGSDVSYEDILESEDIYTKYSITLEGEGKVKGRDCYIVSLRAKVENVSYYQRKMWVDKEFFIPWKEEIFAQSGRLLKVAEVEEVRTFDNKYYPTKTVVSDKLKESTKTVIQIQDASFDVGISDSIFTKRYLER